ncbi:MAG: hypothetical protein U0Q18_03200 [Bryobacteraceae bacterium]
MRAFRRLGCFGSLIFLVLFSVAFTALMVPWAFHTGGRWTLMTEWRGVGILRDSTGRQYALYVSFFPSLRRGGGVRSGPAMPWPRSSLRGSAIVCTQPGVRIPFDLRGNLYGAWLDADGKELQVSLNEQAKNKPRRHFSLYGSFWGPRLVLDDHKSMFMYLLPDGKLTPARSYTSPVPERHASVTLEWGDESDLDHLCRELPR